ncbi:hypothetical protein [Litorimonas sp.]|uniref:hypothetical protein n=1 Tax=Litorimonas sp. TaxID=1892381 RepID=UPI003A86F95A
MTSAEETVCKNIRHCLDILKRHNPNEFDYQVLKNEFSGFGKTGKNRLLKAMAENDSDLSKNAAILLSLSSYELSAADLKRLTDKWPNGDIDSLANLMIHEYSPPIRQAAIATLGSPDQDIAFWSRKILKFGEMKSRLGESKITDFKPSPELFDLLSEAARANPTKEITQFLAQFPSEQSQPILKDLLSSQSSEVVHAALNGLYVSDRESSIGFLQETVSQLKTGEENIALAIADAVRTQHGDTQDETFIAFAKQILTDSTSSQLETMVGADILMGQGPDIKLPETQMTLIGLKGALAAHGTVPLFYMSGLSQKLGSNIETGLDLLWSAFEQQVSPNRSDFVKALSSIPTNETLLKIIQAALENEADWQVVAHAAEVASTKKLSALEPFLNQVAEAHPVLMARAAALAALDSLSDDKTNYSESRHVWEQKLAGDAKWCSVKAHNFKTESSQLPYFNSVPMAYARQTTRTFLTSALSTGTGWLAGYDLGEFSGGLIYYDNRTGTGKLIYGQAHPDDTGKEYYAPNIVGITPKIQRPLGQYGEEYWAFSGLNHFGSDGAILSVSVRSEEVDVKRHFQLPKAPKAIKRLEDDSFLIGFGKKPEGNASDYAPSISHPPLRLMPDGEVVPGCTKPPNYTIKATP